jgi:excisionase family DNA binding protein
MAEDTESLHEMPDMLTISEVAKYLKLHELTVRRLAREGELPAFKVGRQWRIKRNVMQSSSLCCPAARDSTWPVPRRPWAVPYWPPA